MIQVLYFRLLFDEALYNKRESMERTVNMKKQRLMLLPNVYLTILNTEKFRTNCLSVNILRPLRQREAAMNALLPDVLLRGCRMCKSMGEISAWLDQRYGAGVQAFVRKKGEVQDIGFFFDYIDERFIASEEKLTKDICDLLGSFLLEPVTENGAFRQDYVDGEKINLINSIMAQINDKRSYAAIRLRQEMFADEPYGVSKNGEKSEVEAITPMGLYTHYKYVLAHSQIEIIFVGRADGEYLTDCLRNALKTLPRAVVDPTATSLGRIPESVREVSETMDIVQGNLVMGFRTGITAADPEYPALMLFNSIFGGGVTSKLFLNVRERLSLCYYASSGIDQFKGIMLVSSGVDMDKYERAREEIMSQLELCRNGEITDEEMSAAKSALCSSLRSCNDSLGRMEDFCLGQEIGHYNHTPESLELAIKQVALDEVKQVAQKLRLDTIFFLRGVV